MDIMLRADTDIKFAEYTNTNHVGMTIDQLAALRRSLYAFLKVKGIGGVAFDAAEGIAIRASIAATIVGKPCICFNMGEYKKDKWPTTEEGTYSNERFHYTSGSATSYAMLTYKAIVSDWYFSGNYYFLFTAGAINIPATHKKIVIFCTK